MGIWPIVDARLTSEFLYYWFLSVDLRTLSASGPLPSIAQHAVLNSIITLPPLEEQRAIASVLRAVQRAREATDKFISSMSELKRSLMRQLFTYGTVSLEAAEAGVLKKTGIGLVPAHWSRGGSGPANHSSTVWALCSGESGLALILY